MEPPLPTRQLPTSDQRITGHTLPATRLPGTQSLPCLLPRRCGWELPTQHRKDVTGSKPLFPTPYPPLSYRTGPNPRRRVPDGWGKGNRRPSRSHTHYKCATWFFPPLSRVVDRFANHDGFRPCSPKSPMFSVVRNILLLVSSFHNEVYLDLMTVLGCCCSSATRCVDSTQFR